MVWNEEDQKYIDEIREMLPKIQEKFEKLAKMDIPENLIGFFDEWVWLGNTLDELESSEEFIKKH
ncbi:hypothetical protein [Methanosarcina mazei]|uniref:Uncharacterized protein n=1 Tax=Methanosarcina mazei TaxID=2209 RepID=A0A0F8NIA0_METMZ|nr:hypothetical protein [Methanosarcina mazei]KKH14977.1 hypothetical protein DU44_02340 [Methanosarcina mazei]KKH16179.1 hypothetical protein DU48_01240 [Methanosarcina mazei]KKH17511.1 hypothetical protein DU65_02365 [Methanosarcina mazei]